MITSDLVHRSILCSGYLFFSSLVLSVSAYEYITATGIQSSIKTPSKNVLKKQKKNTSFPKSCQQNNRYQTIIERTSSLYQVDKGLVTAVIAAESCFNHKAISPKGAEGLMQLMPFTAKRFGVKNSFDPMQNITGGVKYLKFLINRFEGDLRLAVAAYNAGEGAVDRYRGIPPYRETKNYVRKVLATLGHPQPAFKNKNIFKSKIQQQKSNLVEIEHSISDSGCKAPQKLRKYTYEIFEGGAIKRFYYMRQNDTMLSAANKIGIDVTTLKSLNKNNGEQLPHNLLVWLCAT